MSAGQRFNLFKAQQPVPPVAERAGTSAAPPAG